MRGRAKPRAATVALLIAAVVVALIAFPGAAWANVVTPEDGPTQNAQKIGDLYKIVFFIGLAVIGTFSTRCSVSARVAAARRPRSRGTRRSRSAGPQPLPRSWQ
jgi:hypothetical protein